MPEQLGDTACQEKWGSKYSDAGFLLLFRFVETNTKEYMDSQLNTTQSRATYFHGNQKYRN